MESILKSGSSSGVQPIIGKACGKVMLFGEYAVLEGGTSILTASPQTAFARFEHIDHTFKMSDQYHVFDPLLFQANQQGLNPHFLIESFQWGRSIIGRFADGQYGYVGAQFPFIQEVLRQTEAVHGYYSIDTQAFGHIQSGQWQKIGIGSSGAATAALCDLLRQLPFPISLDLHTHQKRFTFARDVHRKVQGGLGSGADVASSTFGGIISFKLLSNSIQSEPLIKTISSTLPRTWGLWRGGSHSTVSAIKTVQAWRTDHQQKYDFHIHSLHSCAESALAILESNKPDQAKWCQIIREGGQAMRSFSHSLGIPLWTEVHERWAQLVDHHGGALKSTGAGGDDLTLFVAEDERAERECLTRLKRHSKIRGEELKFFLISDK